MDDIRQLRPEQVDALREVANIGAGHAATALSQMTGQTILISVPRLTIARVETIPPGLLVPATTPAGANLSWNFGGPALDQAFLLLGLAPDTFPWGGATLLVPVTVLGLPPLDAAGLGKLEAWLPAAAAGTTFRSQLATWDGGLTGVSPIVATTIE